MLRALLERIVVGSYLILTLFPHVIAHGHDEYCKQERKPAVPGTPTKR